MPTVLNGMKFGYQKAATCTDDLHVQLYIVHVRQANAAEMKPLVIHSLNPDTFKAPLQVHYFNFSILNNFY